MPKSNTFKSCQQLSEIDEHIFPIDDAIVFTHRPEDGGSTHLCNVGQHLLDYTAVYPRRL
jgi:hypothetical protein